MKHFSAFILTAGLAAFGGSIASANTITGSIAFNGIPTFNTDPMSDATEFSAFDNAHVAAGQHTGDYASVPDDQPVTFTPFRFIPPTPSVTPFWTFLVGSTVYSFDVTSMTSSYDADLNIWNVGGSGIAHITGFDDTAGTWNLSAGQAGDSFYFGSAMATSPQQVPDGAATAVLMAAGALAMGLFGHARRFV